MAAGGDHVEELTNSLKSLLIGIPQDHKKANRDEVVRIVNKLMGDISDLRFKKYYHEVVYVGSFYDNLKIGDADEFDYGIAFEFPKEHFKYVGASSNVPNSYVRFQMTKSSFRQDYAWCMDSESDFMLPEKFFSWFYGLIASTLTKKSAQYAGVTMRRNSPCVTLCIRLPSGNTADVDLAPGIEGYGWPYAACKPPSWTKTAQIEEELKTHPTRSVWHLTTKECHKDLSIGENESVRKQYWRISVSPLEKRFWDGVDGDGGCRKDVLRLLKRMRDTKTLGNLQSYSLKSLVMNNALKGGDSSYWAKDKMGLRLIDMLERLRDALTKKDIRGFFYRDRNLLYGLQDIQAKNVIDRLNRIIKDITSDASKVEKYVNCA